MMPRYYSKKGGTRKTYCQTAFFSKVKPAATSKTTIVEDDASAFRT